MNLLLSIVMLTISWAIPYVEQWRPLVREILTERNYHPYITEDLVLSVIAQESYGNPWAQSWDAADSRGLMQVTCFDWMGIDCDELWEPRENIEWGLFFLQYGIELQFSFDQHVAMEWALKNYNCGPQRLEDNERCGEFYKDRVLYYWYPQIAGKEWSNEIQIGISQASHDARDRWRLGGCYTSH